MVLFTKSPTGRFLLAYSAGDTAQLAPELEAQIVAEGYGTYVTDGDSDDSTSSDTTSSKKTKKK